MNKNKRIVTDEDIKKYIPMVSKFLRDSVVKNWRETSMRKSDSEISLGNTGMSLADIRQQLLMEVVIGLQNYNPEYRTADGRTVKESTFVFQQLWNRTGQAMKRLTRAKTGYGLFACRIEDILDGYKEKE